MARFLNNNDYASIITDEAMLQITRGNDNRILEAEEEAEQDMLDHLTDNYEIERALWEGKSIIEYNNKITYPVGSHFYLEGKIVEALRSINGYKSPTDIEYWQEMIDYNECKVHESKPYSQLLNYQPGDVVRYGNLYFICKNCNGIDFNDIRIPGVTAWNEVEAYEWQANVPYAEMEAVMFEGEFFALTDPLGVDLTQNPMESDNWGKIGEYTPDYEYEFKDTEYVVMNGKLYVPAMEANADKLVEGYNYRVHDPRNANVKKHMTRLAVYYLHRLISPNNISSSRITDYETSITWLRDANRLKINPGIPRKLDEEHKPRTEYAIATFMRSYDPYQNPWQV